ncbi:MAG: hypothetical protein R3277_05555 [Brumimicrobium sp.]|nr:hypothetical protein [Brumimicrobium sp.]
MWTKIKTWINKNLLPKTEFNQHRMVFRTSENHLALLMKLKLEEEGIKVILINKRDSSYNNFGYIELYVRAENVIRAKYIIEKTNE